MNDYVDINVKVRDHCHITRKDALHVEIVISV